MSQQYKRKTARKLKQKPEKPDLDRTKLKDSMNQTTNKINTQKIKPQWKASPWLIQSTEGISGTESRITNALHSNITKEKDSHNPGRLHFLLL